MLSAAFCPCMPPGECPTPRRTPEPPHLRTWGLREEEKKARRTFSSLLLEFCAGGRKTGDKRALLDKKLAASVNILPKAASLYYWKGEIEEATETLLLIKTKTSKVHVLSSYIRPTAQLRRSSW
nr:protein CutA homolog isoform X3 [Loxodonta africana]